MRALPGPLLLHIITQKGKGFAPAENDPVGYHALSKLEPVKTGAQPAAIQKKGPKYQDVFGAWLCDMAERDVRLIGITPAMCEGSGMVEFSQRFPERYYDVAIAEQHAVTLAAGMACDGLKPVVAIYSTFLQRAYDQLIHDVAIQNLPVVFAIDRAGLVGADGPTHAGSFDLSYLRCIPNMTVMAPSDENECRQMLYTAFQMDTPTAVRYPRGAGTGVVPQKQMQMLPVGRGEIRRNGSGIALLAFGSMLNPCLEAGDELDATVVNMRFVKPLDDELIASVAQNHHLLVTVEENTIMGGAGSAVLESLANRRIIIPILQLGLPDIFIDQGDPSQMLADCGLDKAGILRSVRTRLTQQAA
jgi:1-deoxy-D-xylulose-5-phosphate synthase